MTAAVCTTAFLLPSNLAMLALAYAHTQLSAIPAATAIRRGVLAAVVGLLILTTYRLGKPVFVEPLAILLGAGALIAALVAPLNAAWIVIAAGLVGVTMRR